MWQLLPTSVAHGLGMNVIDLPCCAPISLRPCLNTTCMSAMGSGLSWQASHRRQHPTQFKVTEALLQIGQLETALRIHLDTHLQQVIAGVRAMLGDVVEEKFPGNPFAEQTPEHIRERYFDGADGT